MSSTLEQYEFTSSLNNDSNSYIFKDHQFQYSNDLANGSYNANTSEVKFELISLANTNNFINWNESYVMLPLTLSATATAGAFAADVASISPENVFAMSLKNGYQHLVDSLYISLNDNPINQPCQGANVDMSFRLYQMSSDDRKTLGDMIQFYMDTGDSLRYIPTTNGVVNTVYYTGNSTLTSISNAGLATIGAAPVIAVQVGQRFVYGSVTYTVNSVVTTTTFNVTPIPLAAINAGGAGISWITPNSVSNSGLGECNNVISKSSMFNPRDGFQTSNGTVNKGRLERMMNTSFDPTSANNPFTTYFQSQAQASYEWKNFVSVNNQTQISYNMFAVIPMCILHDFFDKLPLARGLSVKLNLYLNTGITINETISPAQHVGITSFVMPRQTCPFMVSPIANDLTQGSGFSNTGATAVKYTLTLGNTTQTNCRFYASMYSFTPEAEALYISNPEKSILYNDIAQFTIPSVAPNSSVNNLITSGISRIRGILMIPIVSGSSNGCGGLNAAQSPFSSCPATTFPYARITNFQIQISGKPVFSTPIQHAFQFYNQNLRPELSINGGSLKSIGMSSGCISKTDFESGYGYYYVNLSHYESQADDNTSKSVQVLFTNQTTALTLDYLVYVYFEKQINLNCSNGACLSI